MLTKLEKAMIQEKRSKKIAFNLKTKKEFREKEIAKGNAETFTWADINTALMKTGHSPKQILNILVNLNEEKGGK
jgi:hypothetical protein